MERKVLRDRPAKSVKETSNVRGITSSYFEHKRQSLCLAWVDQSKWWSDDVRVTEEDYACAPLSESERMRERERLTRTENETIDDSAKMKAAELKAVKTPQSNSLFPCKALWLAQ